MRIRSLRLVNFRGFEDETIDLDRPLTVLVGVNGAGKSSVLDAVAIGLSSQLGSLYPVNIQGRELRLDDVRQGCRTASVTLRAGYGDADLTEDLIARVTTSGAGVEVRGQLSPWPFKAPEPMPLAIHLRSPRALTSQSSAVTLPEPASGAEAEQWPLDGLQGSLLPFDAFVTWFRLREDLENEQRREGQADHEDASLRAVRRALHLMLPEFANLRARRRPTSHLVVQKGGVTLSLDQLSEGEKGLIAIVGDVARRMAMAGPGLDPLAQEALVLIDEVELHLHPAWQRRVLPSLRRTFPNCQFIVTTHSPQVVSEVPTDAVVLLRDFKFYPPPTPTSGRDSNAILELVMGVPERPEDVARAFDEVRGLIDDGRFAEAHQHLDALRERVTERDGEWLRLDAELDVLERIDASDHQGP